MTKMISQQGLDLIKHFEALHDGDMTLIGLQPKMCPAGIWTVGYGRALVGKDGNFLKGDKDKDKAYALYPNLSKKEAEAMLMEDTHKFSNGVSKFGLSLLQYEFDALVSFAYNVGIGALKNSTLKKRIEQKADGRLIYNAFMMWIKGGGVILPGLVRRRKSEATLFLMGIIEYYK